MYMCVYMCNVFMSLRTKYEGTFACNRSASGETPLVAPYPPLIEPARRDDGRVGRERDRFSYVRDDARVNVR